MHLFITCVFKIDTSVYLNFKEMYERFKIYNLLQLAYNNFIRRYTICGYNSA